MIDWFVGYALGKRQVMAMVWAFVSIYGHCSWTQLAIEAYPDNFDTSSQAIARPA
jgi:Cu/Ag efflux pump CusA